MKGLICREVRVTRRGRPVLRSISARLAPATVCALIGANGAGKSTLLNALAGTSALAGGAVLLDEQPLAAIGAADLARRRAYLQQQHELNFPLRVDQVVQLGRRAHVGGHRLDAEVVAAALAALDATGLASRAYTELSGGERQRVQLARVLAQVWEPLPATRLLLLDEPTAGLDLGHQQLLLRKLRDWAATGAIVVVTLHDFNLALRFADQVWALAEGDLIAEGKPGEVITSAFVQRLVGAEVVVEPRAHCQQMFLL